MHFLAQRQTAAARNSQKNTEKLGAIPNQRIKKRENAFVVVKTPLILSLTPNTPTLTPPFPLILLKKSILIAFCYKNGKKWKKKIHFNIIFAIKMAKSQKKIHFNSILL